MAHRQGVSIRAPAWGATCGLTQAAISQIVSIRAPAWGATLHGKLAHAHFGVSIRAPAWGATAHRPLRQANGLVSIRAPAWGATSLGHRSQHRRRRFNPRPRMGGDRRGSRHGRNKGFQSAPPHGGRHDHGHPHAPVLGVSIRAPAWGATREVKQAEKTMRFQSAPPHGGRRDTHDRALLTAKFQSAPPHGGRHLRIGGGVGNRGFNPRPRMGGDPVIVSIC